MKIRCEVHIGDLVGKVILAPKPEEKVPHLAMKLAAYTMFLPLSPVVEPSTDHPSLLGFDHKPDVMTTNLSGEIDLWIECGAVATQKLNKILRRLPQARIIILKTSIREAKQLRERAESEVKSHERLEIWTWEEPMFETWLNALEEKTEIFGEAGEKYFNLVINETAYSTDMKSI